MTSPKHCPVLYTPAHQSGQRGSGDRVATRIASSTRGIFGSRQDWRTFPYLTCVELFGENGVDLDIMLENADALLSAVKFDSMGLVPVIAQDRATGVVRMLAWANAEALRATVCNGLATFWSRSRNELWEKGKTSGNSMRVHDVRLDCDGDAILYIVDANGPSCHTNATSCFFRSVTANGLAADDGPAPAAAK